MPAKLVIVSGEPQGKEFWIEDEVLRIGSAPNCGVRLVGDDVPAHAATLEYRSGKYSIHNRAGAPLVLSGETVDEHAFGQWDAGTDLYLGAQTVLRLIVEGDPAPAKHEAQPYYEEEEPEEGAAATAAPAKSKVGQWLVIGLCVLGFAFMLLYDQLGLSPGGGPNGEKRNEFKEFHYLIMDLQKVENGELTESEREDMSPQQAMYLRKVLQKARVAELRRDRMQAKRLYEHIRNQLFRKKQGDSTREADSTRESDAAKEADGRKLTVEERVWNFAIAQIAQLNRG